MSYRLIAIDLDGTLIDAAHQPGPGSAAAIAACEARGVRVVLATGRSFASAAPYVRALGLRPPHITLNGAIMVEPNTGRPSVRATLTREQLSLALDLLNERGIAHIVYGAAGIYAVPGTARLDMLAPYGETPAVFCAPAELYDVPAPLKVLAFLHPGSLDQELAAAASERVATIRSGAGFFEFVPPGVSKGEALSELMACYGVTRDEVLAIGDGENDLSMFAVAGMSVAMADAPAAVRAQARALTGTCVEGGVAQALRRFVLCQGVAC
ncbi:MAG: Cof-type HAD-IIB family hydrolase [Oscillochloridaceae bacterium]|nr:Cof-type HAD-IIB family hydrolase [Chloroflexaceae bacterium]MDW8391967.1 Cof-type HAD-IIB family hydrolase [Oscillochloridaceae bacterium]